MVDLTEEMAQVWAALGPAPVHQGRVILFAAAQAGQGVSSVAREFARLSAVRARRPVWLIDADLDEQGQLAAVSAETDRFGTLGRPARASPDQSSFFTVRPHLSDPQGQVLPDVRLITARPCLGGRLWVSQIDRRPLRPGQRLHPLPRPDYWEALRRHADTVVIDAPALERSDTALALAPFADAVILVVAADSGEVGPAVALRAELEAAGGHCAGVVVNRLAPAWPSRRVARP